MVGLYFQSGKLPVRFPIYIAIVALARYLVLDMKNLDMWHMLGVAAAILLLTLAVLSVRFGHSRRGKSSWEGSASIFLRRLI